MIIIDKIKQIFNKSDFIKNSIILTIGTTIAQFIPIVISPVLARLYKPEDYGVLALYTGIASLLGIIATLRYEMAIVLPKEDSSSINIVVLCGIITVIISFISLIIIFFFNKQIALFLKNQELSGWLFFVPVSVFLTGIYQILNYWTIRTKQFKHLSFSKISQTITGSGTNLIFGYAKYGTFGLILGGISGQFVSTVTLFIQSFKNIKNNLVYVTKENIINQARIHKDFPAINSLQAFLDILRDSVVIFLLSYFFNSLTLGLYSFTLRILKTPAALIGSSVSQVFFQKISVSKNNNENLQKLVKKMIFRLTVFAFPIFLILFLFAPYIFGFVFGEKWREAGVYTQILTPWLFINFISSPISQIPLIVGKQKMFFCLSLIGNSLLILSILFGGLISRDIKMGLVVLSASQFIFLSFLIFWIFKISNKKESV